MKNKRVDQVFKAWRDVTMGSRKGNQRVARSVARQFEDSTLDKVWGLVPVYTGTVIRRRGN